MRLGRTVRIFVYVRNTHASHPGGTILKQDSSGGVVVQEETMVADGGGQSWFNGGGGAVSTRLRRIALVVELQK